MVGIDHLVQLVDTAVYAESARLPRIMLVYEYAGQNSLEPDSSSTLRAQRGVHADLFAKCLLGLVPYAWPRAGAW